MGTAEECLEVLIRPRPGRREHGRPFPESRVDGRLARVEEQEVDPKRPFGRFPNGADVPRNPLGWGARDAQCAQTARVADSRDERYGGVAGHAAQCDGVPNL